MQWRLAGLPRQICRLRSITHCPDWPLSQGQSIRFLGTTSPAPLHVTHSNLLSNDNHSSVNDYADKDLRIHGLIRSIRKQKRIAFAHVSDGSTLEPVQAVLSPDLATGLTNGSYVELVGKWQKSGGQGQSHELQVSEVIHVGETDPDEYPIQKQSQTFEYLRTIPHLRIRTPFHSLLARARSKIISSISEHFENAHTFPCIQVHPPLITSSDCEGAGEVFTVKPKSSVPPPMAGEEASPQKQKHEQEQSYFREPKYLTVSTQLHLETYSAALGDVWALSPTFRAEESDTARHLSEFYMLEAEYRGVTSIEQVTSRIEKLVKAITSALRNARIGKELVAYYADVKHRGPSSEIVNLEERWQKVSGPWSIFTYTDVMDELVKAYASNQKVFLNEPKWEDGLQLEHERWIVEHLANNQPTFVTHYPQSIKPFYMLPSNITTSYEGNLSGDQSQSPEKQTVACFDLLMPFGYAEVVGGSLREHRLDCLVDTMRKKGLLKETTTNGKSPAEEQKQYCLRPNESLGSLHWYADLRRFGSSPHGGFGLGFDRLLAFLTGRSNVRDVVAFPRTWGRADC